MENNVQIFKSVDDEFTDIYCQFLNDDIKNSFKAILETIRKKNEIIIAENNKLLNHESSSNHFNDIGLTNREKINAILSDDRGAQDIKDGPGVVQVFDNTQYNEIKQIEDSRSNEYMGFIYVMEWGDNIKIGCTKSPYQRLKALKRQAEKYGNTSIDRVAITIEHTNYKENERIIHKQFEKHQIGNTELFKAPFLYVVSEISDCLVYKDESRAMK